jgi:prepilin signal peptidase PulO-like enzyme (type II secretory pathway)
MLQRIQSLWLLLAAICAALSLKYPFATGFVLDATAVQGKLTAYLNGTYDFVNLLLTVVIAGGALVNIFNYKQRRLQFGFTLVFILAALLNLFQYYMETKKMTEVNFNLAAVLSLSIPIWLILAVRGISRDRKLIKSLDRLR